VHVNLKNLLKICTQKEWVLTKEQTTNCKPQKTSKTFPRVCNNNTHMRKISKLVVNVFCG
jgi:hypothetical protein